MIDVSRHFFSIGVLKKQIDILSSYGINRLHLHLTDAGGWRFEVSAYPRLTSVAAWRTKSDWDEWWIEGDRSYLSQGDPGAYGGFYTREELKELVGYAEKRGVMIVPEVEVPGHSEEVTSVYPELKCEANEGVQSDLCASNPLVYQFVDEVIREISSIFTSPYIHLGGDEASKLHWRGCNRCQSLARERGLSSTDDLQGELLHYAMSRVIELGKTPLCWDDALCARLPKEAIIMVWHDVASLQRAQALGHKVIFALSRYSYLDYAQDAPHSQPRSFGGYLPLRKVWDMPLPEDILGLHGVLWTEYVETPQHLEYMLYPRILAIAKLAEKKGWRKPYEKEKKGLLQQIEQLKRQGVNAFDLANELGSRKESLRKRRHKGQRARVSYRVPLDPKYQAGGVLALVDGLGGDWDHSDGRWQGFPGERGLDVLLDFSKIVTLHEIRMDFLQMDNAFIFPPSDLRFSVSDDGVRYTEIYCQQRAKTKQKKTVVEPRKWKGKQKARYLRVQARAERAEDWIFTDEIVVL